MGAHSIFVVENHFRNSGIQNNLDFCSNAFLEEHGHNVAGRPIAKKLALSSAWIRRLFVVGNAVFFDEFEKIVWSKSSQG